MLSTCFIFSFNQIFSFIYSAITFGLQSLVHGNPSSCSHKLLHTLADKHTLNYMITKLQFKYSFYYCAICVINSIVFFELSYNSFRLCLLLCNSLRNLDFFFRYKSIVFLFVCQCWKKSFTSSSLWNRKLITAWTVSTFHSQH